MSDEANRLWQDLSDRVDRFLAAWESGTEPPSIEAFLPAGPEGFRRLVVSELAKLDLELRWAEGRRDRRVEDYLALHPELEADRTITVDLAYEEFHARQRAGEAVRLDEYERRFPGEAGALARKIDAESAYVRTVLVDPSTRAAAEPMKSVDDFDLLNQLGRGAFAVVYLARQRSMGRMVALKVSSAKGSEPQTLAQLDHPYIVRVHDQRHLEAEDLRLLYMEFVPGGTLEAVIAKVAGTPLEARRGADLFEAIDESLRRTGFEPSTGTGVRARMASTPWADVVAWIGARIAAGLDHAHGRGVLHRDVKPANVLLSAEGVPKLVDFNISFDSKLAGSTPAAYFGGSLAYMSPEQMEAASIRHEREPDELDARSDVYSAGVVLWELLAGRRPFPDPSLDRGWWDVLDTEAARRRAGVPESAARALPPEADELRDVLLECLEPDPARRPATAGELARRLDLCRRRGASRYLRPPAGGWAARCLPLAAPIFLALAVLPNAAAGVFNFVYNRRHIVESLEGAADAFLAVQSAVNGIAFPLGMLLAWLLARPVLAAAASRRDDPSARRACLSLGHRYSLISVGLWLVAGIAYPFSLRVTVGDMPAAAAVHFFASLALCGLIAAAYPFFLVTGFSLRAVYPRLVGSTSGTPEDRAALVRLGRRNTVYLALASSVPLASLLLMVVFDAGDRVALAIVGAAGLAGLGLAFWLSQSIHRARRVFLHALLPIDEALGDETALL